MIEGYRYVRTPAGDVVSSRNRVAWLRARLWGVTATDARRLVTTSGRVSKQRRRLLEAKLTGWEGPRLPQFEHGIRREAVIAAWVHQRFGIAPSSLLCAGRDPRHLATPDGIGEHSIAEIKTSVEDLDGAARTYADQLQWQLHVTGCDRVLFVVEHRDTLRRDFRWVERDEERIELLRTHANAFLNELDRARALLVAAGDRPVDRRELRDLDLSGPPENAQARSMGAAAG
ncbi:YqaJ viral recombinase family protein [Ruania alkalisoli]|uniref:YqaJ viral recombinase family protein n=1 Tax=Ruania alkalisoli TaxID=2779775 RepID=A0A7M1SNF7_9MICO|nr:YqaJ viral recombinase family protein [Ruania alkalisoli]QOR69106.1 YqaJ viral recombinase family protein [Ruania alkalisoli]